MFFKLPLIFIAVSCITVNAHSQYNPDVVDKITGFPPSFFNKIMEPRFIITGEIKTAGIRQKGKIISAVKCPVK